MSISVVVRRGPGTHPGTPISDPLINSLPVALARGRNELDEHACGMQPVDVEVRFRPGLRNGQVVKVQELLYGTEWYGKIVSISHRFEAGQSTTNLRLLHPTDFVV